MTADGMISLLSMPSRTVTWPHVELDAAGFVTGYFSMGDAHHPREVGSDAVSGMETLVVMGYAYAASCPSPEHITIEVATGTCGCTVSFYDI